MELIPTVAEVLRSQTASDWLTVIEPRNFGGR